MTERLPLSLDEELEIALQMLEGDREGLFRLLEAFAPRVKWLLRVKLERTLTDADIDHILLLAAEKAFKKADSFDERKCRLGGWFYTIAFRTAVDRYRRIGGKPCVQLDDNNPPAPVVKEAADDESPIDDALRADLLECVGELGELQRKIIEADLLAGGLVDADQLSKKLGIPKQHVYSYREKAHKALEKRMTKRGHTAETVRSKT